MVGKFEAQVAEFARLTKEKMLLVVKQSAQDVFEAAQTSKALGGNMPVRTGYLRNTSFVAGLNGSFTQEGGDSYVLVIAGMELGDFMIGGWKASYARHVEYGTSKMAGSFFALRAAMEWQAIVARNVQKAQAL
jgi:hypothetical protein